MFIIIYIIYKMAAIGFAGELALAGAFWFSHLAMALFTRKYRKKNPKRVIANNQPELPVSGQILVIGIDGELTAVPNDMAVVCSDYGGGDIVYQVSGGSVIMGPDGYGENSFLRSRPSPRALDIPLLDEYCPLDKEKIGRDLLDEYCPLDEPLVHKDQVVTETPVDTVNIVDETVEVDSDDEQYHSLMNLSSLQ
jgi:hypothetical protein